MGGRFEPKALQCKRFPQRYGLEQKYKNAAKEYIWQWFFPAPTLTFIPKLQEQRRYHLHESHVQGAIKHAAARLSIPKRVSPHTLRHTFASH